jgi:hypothetical protein
VGERVASRVDVDGRSAGGVVTVRGKLTAEQRKRVRELMQDEGYTRTEAVAWVLTFGTGAS